MSNNINLINQLPEEVTLNILSFLKVPDLGNSSQVCQTWLRISSDDSLWKPFCHPQDSVSEWPAKKCVKKITQPLENFVLDTIQEFVNKIGLCQHGKIEFKFSMHPECSINAKMSVYRSDEGIKASDLNETIEFTNAVPYLSKRPQTDFNLDFLNDVNANVKVFDTPTQNAALKFKLMQILKKREEELKALPHTYYYYLTQVWIFTLATLASPIFAGYFVFVWPFQTLIEWIRNRFFTPQESG